MMKPTSASRKTAALIAPVWNVQEAQLKRR